MPNQRSADYDYSTRHLFRRFPGLIGRLPWMPMAKLPTPVEKLETLGASLDMKELWIKRDDLSSDLYSGNKPRKMEFIFADVERKGRRDVVTMGSHGSNHGAATTLFCRRYGFNPTLIVNPQPILTYVRQNILINHSNRARIICSGNPASTVVKMLSLYLGAKLKGRVPPYIMYFGGSSRVGNAGFVEAGLELAEQIKRGEMPAPRHLFVATGSCGTHAGLMLGLRIAGLETEVIGVRIVPKAVTNRFVVALHTNRIARYLKALDPSFPAIRVRTSDIHLLEDFYGGQYGRPTPEGKDAIRTLRESEGLALDPTYTAKSFAGMLHFIRENRPVDDPVLFWQTLNGVDLSEHYEGVSQEGLCLELRRYFTEPLHDPDL